MPTSVLIGGKRYFKPGVYGAPDASKVGGKAVSFGNLAIVGAFPQLEHDVVHEILSPAALTSWDPSSLDFARLAKLAFKPIVGGAGCNKLFLLNIQTNTQASKTFQSSGAVDSLKLASKLWGVKGNQVWVKIADNISAGKDITISQPGFSGETYTGITTGNVIEFKVDTTICTDLSGANDLMKANLLQASWKLHWEKRLPALAADFNPTVLPVASKLQIKASADSGAPITVTVVGTGLRNSIPWSGTATFTFSQVAQLATTYVDITDAGVAVTWSEITKITNNGGAGAVYDVKGWAIDTSLTGVNPPLTNFTYLSDAAAYVNNLNNKGWFANIKSPKAYQIPVAEFEEPSADQNIKDTSLYIKADVWAIIQALSASNIVVATRPTGSIRTPVNTTGTLLANGQEDPVTVATDYPAGFTVLENVDIQRIVPLSSNIEAHKAVKTHCYNAAVKFARERNAWVGCPGATALATIKSDYVNILNYRNVTLVADKIKIAAVKGGDVAAWLEPQYLAVQLAAIQCGLKPGTSLTNRVPDILDFSHAWADGSDEDSVIEGGICGLYKDNLGNPAVLRSVTTWVQDDLPAYSETSANDSVNTSIRDLRSYLRSLIGLSIDSTLPPSVVEAMASSRLEYQVAQGWIKSFADVAVSLQTDTFSVDYTLDEVQPVNFIVVTPHVG